MVPRGRLRMPGDARGSGRAGEEEVGADARCAVRSADRRRSRAGRRPVVGRLRRHSSTRRECRERRETASRGEGGADMVREGTGGEEGRRGRMEQ